MYNLDVLLSQFGTSPLFQNSLKVPYKCYWPQWLPLQFSAVALQNVQEKLMIISLTFSLPKDDFQAFNVLNPKLEA